MRRVSYILVFITCLSVSVTGQESEVYDLLTEPALSRPLTLHKGFLQVYGGYSHHIGNNFFDESGTKLPFTELARSLIEDRYRIEISYGVLNFLEIHTGISYRDRYETLPTYIIDDRPGTGTENRTYHQFGMSNLDVNVKVRIPEFIDGLDMLIYGGVLTPISSQYPKLPNHSILLLGKDPDASYVQTYEFNPPAGSRALYYSTGFHILYARDRIGVSVNMDLQQAFSDIETFTWASRRYVNVFLYQKLWYLTKPKGLLSMGSHIETQVFPWFAVNFGYELYKETPGWSNLTGQSISLNTSSSGFINTGFEIQVSTHLRFLQQVNIPIHGRNLYSEFNVSVGMAYSLVPLKNKYY